MKKTPDQLVIFCEPTKSKGKSSSPEVYHLLVELFRQSSFWVAAFLWCKWTSDAFQSILNVSNLSISFAEEMFLVYQKTLQTNYTTGIMHQI